MNKKFFFTTLCILLFPVALLGCSSKAPASPTTNPDTIYTAAAQTADARLTQYFLLTPSATPVTPSPTFDFVQTMAAQTASALLTQSAQLTPSPQASASVTPTPPSTGGDRAVFVADITIPDGTNLASGASFTKTWRLQNSGTSTWTASYSLAFASGEQMGAVESVHLSQSVAPGAQIDVSVDMKAPSAAGSHQGYWKMKNASGQFFNDIIYVLISVGSGGTPQPTSTGAPGATPTITGTPTNPVSNLTMSVEPPDTFNGNCPYTFNFFATFTLNRAATLTYSLEAGSETPGFQFNLPGPQTGDYVIGSFTVPFAMQFTSSGSGWVRFHITSPVDMTSNQSTFTLTCTH